MQMKPKRFSARVRRLLEDETNTLYLSAASSLEIAIKWAIGKLPLPMPPIEYVTSRMERQAVLGLPVEHRHALRVSELPLHHKDPFDRLLIAQAQSEDLVLLSVDSEFGDYDVRLLRAS